MEGINRCQSAMEQTRNQSKKKSAKKLKPPKSPITKLVDEEYKKCQVMKIVDNNSIDKEPESPSI